MPFLSVPASQCTLIGPSTSTARDVPIERCRPYVRRCARHSDWPGRHTAHACVRVRTDVLCTQANFVVLCRSKQAAGALYCGRSMEGDTGAGFWASLPCTASYATISLLFHLRGYFSSFLWDSKEYYTPSSTHTHVLTDCPCSASPRQELTGHD